MSGSSNTYPWVRNAGPSQSGSSNERTHFLPSGPPATYDSHNRSEAPGRRSSGREGRASTVSELDSTALSYINGPIHLTDGHFRGRTVRAQLHEIQAPELGRKYAVKDRRPLEPPSIVQLRLFEQQLDRRTQEWSEHEMTYSDLLESEFVCHLDLFPVPRQRSFQPNNTEAAALPNQNPSGAAYLSGQTVPESSKQTQALAGETFVEASKLEYQGRPVLFFVFSDVSVRLEGMFLLRYRCMYVPSSTGTGAATGTGMGHTVPSVPPRPRVVAECLGNPFRVYSTKDFPGLPASTDLTKHVARYGVRANIRVQKRVRQRKTGGSSYLDSSAYPGYAVDGEDGEDDQEEEEEEEHKGAM